MINSAGIKISAQAVVSALVILLAMMLAAGVMTQVVPAGSFERQIIEDREVIIPGSFVLSDAPNLPIWRWFTAPVEVLWGPDTVIVIAVILFILIIGGSFTVMDQVGILQAALARVVRAFGGRKYILLLTVTLSFMAFGSLMGILEEILVLIPLVVALSWSLGWDSLTGLGMSLLATGFGFAAAVSNPFSVGVAQSIAGLPTFSGAGFRMLGFVLVYVMLAGFLLLHVRKIEIDPRRSPVYELDVEAQARHSNNLGESRLVPAKALTWFAGSMVLLIILIMAASLVPALTGLSLPLMALAFLISGIGCGLSAGLRGRQVGKVFVQGVGGIAPGIPLILMAMSVKHIIAAGGVMDTLLWRASEAITGTSPSVAVMFIYALVLGMNFFIGSASAKAFLVMPLIAPLADLVGITRQVAVLAFAFGDGFSNVLYPTNPVLLIGLGLTVVSYPRWFKWVIKLQLLILVLTVVLLLLAVAIDLGPW